MAGICGVSLRLWLGIVYHYEKQSKCLVNIAFRFDILSPVVMSSSKYKSSLKLLKSSTNFYWFMINRFQEIQEKKADKNFVPKSVQKIIKRTN